MAVGKPKSNSRYQIRLVDMIEQKSSGIMNGRRLLGLFLRPSSHVVLMVHNLEALQKFTYLYLLIFCVVPSLWCQMTL